MKPFNYYIPSRILFGAGKLNELATVKLPGKKALIVTTGGQSVKKYGYLDRVVNLLNRWTRSSSTRCCPIRSGHT